MVGVVGSLPACTEPQSLFIHISAVLLVLLFLTFCSIVFPLFLHFICFIRYWGQKWLDCELLSVGLVILFQIEMQT